MTGDNEPEYATVQLVKKIADQMKDLESRLSAIEDKQVDYLLIDMEELAQYVKVSIKHLESIGSEKSIQEVLQVKKMRGDSTAFVTCLDKLQEAGVSARMAITVLFSIMNVMNRFEKKIIFDEENRKK